MPVNHNSHFIGNGFLRLVERVLFTHYMREMQHFLPLYQARIDDQPEPVQMSRSFAITLIPQSLL